MNSEHNLTTGKPSPLNLAKWAGEMQYLQQLDGVLAAPKYHHVTFENEFMRVLSIQIQPGEEEEIHTHNYKSALWFTDYSPCVYTEYEWDEQKNLVPARSFMLPQLTPENAIELPAEGPHTVKNVGDKLLKLYRVELKQ